MHKNLHSKIISLSFTVIILFLTPFIGCSLQEENEKYFTTLSSISANQKSGIDTDVPVKNWSKVSYKDVELSIPDNWNYKSQEIEVDFAYQISCWEKGGSNTFTIQWLEDEVDLQEYLMIIKESLKKEPTHKEVVFSNSRTGIFQNNKTLYTTFSGSYLDFQFKGKLMTFNNNGKGYLIMQQGDNDFLFSQTPDKIMSTLKLGSPKELNQSKVLEAWNLYEIENIGQIRVPNTLELRDDNSYIALATDIMHDAISTRLKIKMIKHQLVFQPKGRNQLDKESSTKYARIMIMHIEAEYGDFYRWNEKIELSDSEKTELNNDAKNEISSPMAAMNIKLIEWFPIEFGSVNGLSYMKTSFTRQLANNPIVNVDTYRFFNSDEAVEITLSYRVSESNIWKSDFSKVIKTFDFKNKK